MENSNAVSEYLYEDEFSFVTREGGIHLKENDYQPRKKIGETSRKNMEENLAAFRSNFIDLEKQVDKLDEGVSESKIEKCRARLQQEAAIGDFGRLFTELDELQKTCSKDGSETNAEPEESRNDEAAVEFYKNLKKQAQEVSNSDDWDTASGKLDELSHRWSDGPEVQEEEAKEQVRDLYYKFTKAEEHFRNRKQTHFEKAAEKRKENLSKKREVVDRIEEIVDDEKWNATGAVKKLQTKWRKTGSVPKEKAGDLKSNYQSLIKEFKSHKVDRLVARRQKREDNLMMKMTILDKMEKVANSINKNSENWDEIDATFDNLTKQWKKIGRVPREKSNEVWQRYKAAQDVFYDKKYKYNIDHRSNVDSFTAKKENVIEEANKLVDQDDMARAARKVNKLHRRWKKIGNLPQRKEDELWERFKAATDAFNEKKAKHPEKIEQQEEQHYRQKLKLIEHAEEIKTTDDWEKGHQTMQSLMKKWKQIGPVPRKKSGKIWKQFKGAMDEFYDRRRARFKEQKEQQKKNLQKKEKILDQLRELGRHNDPVKAVDEAKKLQAQFKDIGYVPIKKKNETWKTYREVCDVIYDRMRAAKSGNKFDRELAKADLEPEQRAQIQDLRKQHGKMKKKVRSLKKELLQLQESKENFNFSGEDNPFYKEMLDKINTAKAKLENKQNKLDAIEMEMEDIREQA